ncbi:tRNA (N6-isopentenyl adenosine(37)-C2)-methylthiotransferase MiaB [Geoalkalibacter halelectricus]|uniref:tRNA-2-methylthio-N(6)-dimethylallyladenosine synthase n=1 Tax=Geoalkalibacter halelectricus TaxID=2847045 RepID=A0ABY5ZG17_9BACT|nr:tRNA (N6-isopentenyl adenosine(37)-C2)-methylthiotransferase MiaB [Geoalkalibacter halelectricus]MDO3379518.1 tRNA (N6-isopentenyl adenosine(37)-C2)-methylthiotransferase MiaB [Geoalkalibacter halelectricus]UWZ78107.1 tRNA (N6-isopentenyl adenosine(37)-C2)-methylthiotransferase MiaB [Geoalkalibacter halelectricus]
MTKFFYLETFGCQMNVVDSEQIVDLLGRVGYAQVETPEQADLILLNTCSVRDKAERKVYGHLGRFKPLKQQRPELIIGVGGCVAQQEGERLLDKLRFVDLVFGTHNIHRLPEMLAAVEGRRQRRLETDFLDAETRRQLFPERKADDAVTRFVTVMQGCDNFCSYCIVPHVRGREISRPSGDILAEIRALAAGGVREITLLGQNVNSYGLREEDEISFAQLLRRVHEIEGIERIRFTTSHPKDLSDELIACFGELPKLAKHLHLPVQCGSDRILTAMNRGYTRAQYLDKVARLKQVCPDIRLTSDIIVGFPGETEEDFGETLALVAEVEYADIYSFLYSPRRGTAAAELEETLDPKEKQARFDRLIALQQEIGARIWQSDVGRVLPVLVEGVSRQGGGQLFGRTVWNRIVNFSGSPDLVGRIVPVRVTTSFKNSQAGELDADEVRAAS